MTAPRGQRRHKSPRRPPIPPGQVLAEEFLRPLGISQNGLARAIGVPPARVNDLVHNRRAVTADTAVRLSIYFGTSIDFWINLRAQYDTRVAREQLQPKLHRQVRPYAAAPGAWPPAQRLNSGRGSR